MPTYKLHYFNGRGRAEVSRLIFTVAGQKFEDHRFEFQQWPTLKSQMPLGQAPVLEIDELQLPQSVSIARYLAKEFNLAGTGNLEQAKVDAVGDTINDIIEANGPSRQEKDETKKQALIEKFRTEELPKHLQNLDKLGEMYGNGGPFFVGNNLTWADLFFYDVAESMLKIDGSCLDKHPWLKQNRAEVEKNPQVAEYLKNRPTTSF